MVEKKKSGKTGKSKTKDTATKAENGPDVNRLTASLDALAPEADNEDDRQAARLLKVDDQEDPKIYASGIPGDIVDFSARKDRSSVENEARNDQDRNRDRAEKSQTSGQQEGERQGVVELLGALRVDIDSLRKDNEEFKARLMRSPLARGNTPQGNRSDNGDMRALLEALKADIGHLREENEMLRAQAVSAQSTEMPDPDEEEQGELAQVIGELRDDIVSLRSENNALRKGVSKGTQASARAGKDEVASILHELKDDINALKHDNEELRLENLVARDGARFENPGSQFEAYRNQDNRLVPVLMKGLAGLLLVAGAAGGGYYLARVQDGAGQLPKMMKRDAPIVHTARNNSPSGSSGRTAQKTLGSKITRMTKLSTGMKSSGVTPRTKPADVASPSKNAAPVATTGAKAASTRGDLDAGTHKAMMARAEGLLRDHDLAAARMVYVYLARHGSAQAMTRLARTYDPRFLTENSFNPATGGDLARARRLYGVAMKMGDVQAARYLKK